MKTARKNQLKLRAMHAAMHECIHRLLDATEGDTPVFISEWDENDPVAPASWQEHDYMQEVYADVLHSVIDALRPALVHLETLDGEYEP